jgi:hypothetical protein
VYSRLNRTREQVRRQRLKVLQHEHADGGAEHLVRVLVVRVLDVGRPDEHFERIVLVRLAGAAFNLALDLLHPLLAVRREAEILLVAPEHGRPRTDGRLAEHVVQIHNLILAIVADQHKERALSEHHAIVDERAHARVNLLLNHRGGAVHSCRVSRAVACGGCGVAVECVAGVVVLTVAEWRWWRCVSVCE